MTELDYKAIPGYEGKYEINLLADIQRIWKKSGKRTQMKPSLKKGNLVIKLSDDKGKRTMYKVSQLMAATFLKGYEKGCSIYHLNGVKTDNEFANLKIISKKELGKLTGAQSNRRTVVKIGADGEAVEFYSSAREAGRQNFMSYQTVLDYCNNKTKKKVAPDGYVYKWANNFV